MWVFCIDSPARGLIWAEMETEIGLVEYSAGLSMLNGARRGHILYCVNTHTQSQLHPSSPVVFYKREARLAWHVNSNCRKETDTYSEIEDTWNQFGQTRWLEGWDGRKSFIFLSCISVFISFCFVYVLSFSPFSLLTSCFHLFPPFALFLPPSLPLFPALWFFTLVLIFPFFCMTLFLSLFTLLSPLPALIFHQSRWRNL